MDKNSPQFLNAPLLAQAFIHYAREDHLEVLRDIPTDYERRNPAPDAKIADMIGQALAEIQAVNQNIEKRQKIAQFLRRSLLERLQTGELTAFGFSLPRNIEDQPIKIPPDLFGDAEINWEKSTLKYQNLSFSGIRILQDAGIIIDMPAKQPKSAPAKIENNFELNSKNNKTKKPQKTNFAELSPDRYINEKLAGEFLGISPRTLQGYRLKGGGPQFLKLKKSVRYKMQDLIDWTDKNKKENTSQ